MISGGVCSHTAVVYFVVSRLHSGVMVTHNAKAVLLADRAHSERYMHLCYVLFR